jgi:tRNA(fMet)-specific endonuclease VapC
VKYLLDTDHISFLQEGSGPEYAALAARMAQHPPADFAFCVVSLHEQALGAHAYLARAQSNAEVVRGYALLLNVLHSFAPATVLPFDSAAANVFDGLRAQKVRVATMDLRIAAIALSRGSVLLTRNSVDFTRVPGLVSEDWTA